MVPHLPETLRRINDLIQEQDLARSELLNIHDIARAAALEESVVGCLLDGGAPPEDTVNDRVRARLKILSDTYLARTERRMSDLAGEVAERLKISDYWARQLCGGKKMPNVEVLRGLVEFFDVDGEEAFFTAPADEAVNRVLLPILRALDTTETDPVLALMEKYGVKALDLRHSPLTPQQLDQLLAGVLHSVLPPREGTQ
ncbi:hypothetical protein Slala03_81000 [Streptomyces lavendulae subsp. lavendulae]|uniref:hypothetical protein n=1 Tax=Streptomyces lavendulae TaxID=1914 RepID=UPI0024A2562F|nr:hypothetical protein [Streptomyces lavendulae]GLV88411.1 hypothetical protein Slala03_81000 [Streptomyces lavendulae subsp. lavendulae]